VHLSSHFPGDGGRDNLLKGNLFCEVSYGATVSVGVIKLCSILHWTQNNLSAIFHCLNG